MVLLIGVCNGLSSQAQGLEGDRVMAFLGLEDGTIY